MTPSTRLPGIAVLALVSTNLTCMKPKTKETSVAYGADTATPVLLASLACKCLLIWSEGSWMHPYFHHETCFPACLGTQWGSPWPEDWGTKADTTGSWGEMYLIHPNTRCNGKREEDHPTHPGGQGRFPGGDGT